MVLPPRGGAGNVCSASTYGRNIYNPLLLMGILSTWPKTRPYMFPSLSFSERTASWTIGARLWYSFLDPVAESSRIMQLCCLESKVMSHDKALLSKAASTSTNAKASLAQRSWFFFFTLKGCFWASPKKKNWKCFFFFKTVNGLNGYFIERNTVFAQGFFLFWKKSKEENSAC